MGDWDDTTNVNQIVDNEPQALEERNRAYLIVLTGSNVGEMYKLGGGEVVIGRSQQADIHLLDDGISRQHARLRSDGEAVVIEDLESRNGTYCNGQRIQSQTLRDGDKIQVGRTTILKFTYHDNLDESFQKQMFESALRDGLTRAFNKRYFLERLHSEFRFAHRHAHPLSLILLDLDHFKKINDRFGHIAGDHVLVALATRLQQAIRNEDVFARYGGEEFGVISRLTAERDAAAFAERLRSVVEELDFRHSGTRIPITISVGVASFPTVKVADAIGLLTAADQALYRAKQEGRNRVSVCGL